MPRITTATTLAAMLLLAAGPANADSLVLRDGTVLEGSLVAAGDATVHFRSGERVYHLDVADVESLRFARPDVTALRDEPAPSPQGRARIVGDGPGQQIERR